MAGNGKTMTKTVKKRYNVSELK